MEVVARNNSPAAASFCRIIRTRFLGVSCGMESPENFTTAWQEETSMAQALQWQEIGLFFIVFPHNITVFHG